MMSMDEGSCCEKQAKKGRLLVWKRKKGMSVRVSDDALARG